MKKPPKFSIIIPCYSETSPKQEGAAGHIHYRGNRVQRAIKSVITQQFPDWELIVVEDGCVDEVTPGILDKFAEADKRIKIIHKTNENRAIARNTGMEEATGEWICWLDSDDEYSSHYLRELDAAIEDFPEYNIFNFGSLIYYEDHHTLVRPVFQPELEGEGHVWFRSGHIGAGSFIFKRELWLTEGKKQVRTEDELGNPIITEEIGQIYRIPDEVNPYQFAAASLFPYKMNREEDEYKYDNTENPEGMFQDGVKRHGSSLGNPWGDDFIQFYLLTRDNQSKPLDVLLYFQYPRSNEERYEHYGEIYT